MNQEELQVQTKNQETLVWAEKIIQQTHFETLELLNPVPLDTAVNDIRSGDAVCLFQVTELVFNQQEGSLEELTTVLNSLHASGASCLMLLQCQNGKGELYLGAVNKQRYNNTFYLNTIREILRSGIEGNLPGTELKEILSRKDIEDKLSQCLDNGFDCQCITSISCVASDSKEGKGRVVGIESLLEAVGQKNFSLLIIADPVSRSQVQNIRRGYEELGSQLSVMEGMTFSVQSGNSVSMSENYSQSFSHSVNQSVSLTQSHTSGNGWSKGMGYSESQQDTRGQCVRGAAVIAGLGAMTIQPTAGLFAMNAVSSLLGKPASQTSINESQNGNESDTSGRQDTKGIADTDTRQTGAGVSHSETKNVSVQRTVKDKHISELISRVDWYLKWLNQCENYGMFDCCAYVISSSADINLMVASQYQALMQGEGKVNQPVTINTWTRENGVETIRQSLSHLVHPLLECDGLESKLSPAMLLSSRELSRQMALPQKSVVGVSVTEYASFGREVVRKTPIKSGKVAKIGIVSHMGKAVPTQPVLLDIQSLTAHTFVAGTNGSGKSNTIFRLLEELMRADIPFMVIEPAKGEYKNVFGSESNVKVYGTNRRKTHLLRLNPFWFNEDIEVREHIDKLMDVFNASWPMYAAMPKVLEDAIEDAYIHCGWDVRNSRCRGARIFPTARDVLNQFEKKMDRTAFSQEVKGNYIGALSTRLESLCKGIYEDVFSGADMGDEALFDSNVIIDLSRVGSAETKAMIMGLLIIRLREYRGDYAMNFPLRHVMVLEEAHNILKKTSAMQTEDSANLVGKSVEMLANCIAEMRSYGDGFIIADQSPGLLDTSVMRNTNTKIVLRLPEGSDRELVGRTMGLTQKQTAELAKLKTGMCAVYQQDWLEAVLCQVDKAEHKEIRYDVKQYPDQTDQEQNKLIEVILAPYIEKKKSIDDDIIALISSAPMSGIGKRNLLKELSSCTPDWEKRAAILGELLYIPLDFPDKMDSDHVSNWIEESMIESDLCKEFDEKTVRLLIIAQLYCNAQNGQKWKELYQICNMYRIGKEELISARGIAFQVLCPLQGCNELTVDIEEIKRCTELLKNGFYADKKLSELLVQYLKYGTIRQRGELKPYTEIVWDILDGDCLWPKIQNSIKNMDVQYWDNYMRKFMKDKILGGSEMITSVLSLFLQNRGADTGVSLFYQEWFCKYIVTLKKDIQGSNVK